MTLEHCKTLQNIGMITMNKFVNLNENSLDENE